MVECLVGIGQQINPSVAAFGLRLPHRAAATQLSEARHWFVNIPGSRHLNSS
jgi:hypothetical protein